MKPTAIQRAQRLLTCGNIHACPHQIGHSTVSKQWCVVSEIERAYRDGESVGYRRGVEEAAGAIRCTADPDGSHYYGCHHHKILALLPKEEAK